MKFYTRRRVSPVITIVSLVDILTMVLMFFVYTTTFKTNQPQIIIELPKVQNQADKVVEASPTILNISKEGKLFLNEKPIELDALGAAIKDLQARSGSLALRADKDAPWGAIIGVMDQLKTAGVEKMPAFMRGSQ